MEENVNEVQAEEGKAAESGQGPGESRDAACSGENSERSGEFAEGEFTSPEQVDLARNYDDEVGELLREFPEAAQNGRLPDEVVQAAVLGGKPVVEAYREYALARQGGDRTAGWNADAARRAPVRGVSGGFAVENQGRDAFMAGFEAE